MELHIFDFPAPILCIDNFFDIFQSNAILRECIGCKSLFSPARVFGKKGEIRSASGFRKNDVLYLGDVFKECENDSSILRYFTAIRRENNYRRIWDFFSCFSLISDADWFEIVVSRYGGGSFYQRHTDVDPKHLNHRLITVVYYINEEPQQFTGGSIAFYHGGRTLKLPTIHNRAIIFPSNVVHEVEEVKMCSGTWEAGRFSINYWLGFVNP